jgi:hypothetical protein
MIRMLIVGYRQRRGARRRLGGRRPRRGKECVEAFLAENVRHEVLENDDMARGFGANVIRDLIREAPSQHAGWILEIARGNRVVAAIPFGD